MTPPAPAAPEPALTELVAQLRAERDGLRRAMQTRAVIEQAKGILMVRLGIGPDEAFDELARMSQHTNIRLAEVAAALVGGVAPEPGEPRPTPPADAPATTGPPAGGSVSGGPQAPADAVARAPADAVAQATAEAAAQAPADAGPQDPADAAPGDAGPAGRAGRNGPQAPARTGGGRSTRPERDARSAEARAPTSPPPGRAAGSTDGRARGPAVATPGPAESLAQRLAAQHQLLAARVGAADTYGAVVSAVADADRGWPRPRAVVLVLVEPDGALRLVASSGLDAETRSQWSRIPPLVDIPVTAAVRRAAPVLLPDAAALRERFPVLAALPAPPGATVALPLAVAGRTVGALGLTWHDALDLGGPRDRYLRASADLVARRLPALAGGNGAPASSPATGTPPTWVEPVLAALPDPAAVLAPVLVGGSLVDLVHEHLNPAAEAFAAGQDLDLEGARLLAVFPEAGSQALLPVLRHTLETGEPGHVEGVYVRDPRGGSRRGYRCTFRAARLWDRVLLTWRQADERELLADQVLAGERLARTGSFWWDVDTGEVRWSPELHAIFDRPLSRPPTDMAEMFDYVDARAVTQALKGSDPVSVTVRARGERWLRLIAERVRDEREAVVEVRGVIQEITEERNAEARRRRVEEALAAQRHRARIEEALADAFQQAILPTRGELPPVKGLDVRAVCHTTPRPGRVPTTWYDTIPLRDDETLLVVGEVFGGTDDSLVTAARLCNAIRGYGVLDMDVAAILDALDRMISTLFPRERATVALARFDRSRRRMWCASAGHSQPIRYRSSTERGVPCGPLGPPIGEGTGGYQAASLQMVAGDVVLLHTDGLVVRQREAARGAQVLAAAAGRVDLTDPDAVVRHLSDELGSPAEGDLCVIVGRVR